MAKPGIKELLIGCVLDPQLLRRMREKPEAVLNEYDVSDRARNILSSPDARLLELLGEAAGQPAGAKHPRQMEAERATAPPADVESESAVTLPASRLVVRLVPYVQQAIAAESSPSVVVNYAGHLDPLPEGIEPGDLPDVPAAVTDGEQLPPVSVVVGVQPTLWTDAEGNRQMTFSVSAQLPQDTEAHDPGEAAEASLTPWRHDTHSPAVTAAAESVHEAEAGDRYQRLRALIDAMVAPAESIGETR